MPGELVRTKPSATMRKNWPVDDSPRGVRKRQGHEDQLSPQSLGHASQRQRTEGRGVPWDGTAADTVTGSGDAANSVGAAIAGAGDNRLFDPSIVASMLLEQRQNQQQQQQQQYATMTAATSAASQPFGTTLQLFVPGVGAPLGVAAAAPGGMTTRLFSWSPPAGLHPASLQSILIPHPVGGGPPVVLQTQAPNVVMGPLSSMVAPTAVGSMMAASGQTLQGYGVHPMHVGASMVPYQVASGHLGTSTSSPTVLPAQGSHNHIISSVAASSLPNYRNPSSDRVNSSDTVAKSDNSPKVLPMALPTDSRAITKYQCILRQQIEFFQAAVTDIRARAQGRNVPIRLRQVGIRCRHCSRMRPGYRPRGAVYFPIRLASLYQSAQNMGNNHFTSNACPNVPGEVVKELTELKQGKSSPSSTLSSATGGQRYWIQAANQLGVCDSDQGTGLEFIEPRSK